ESPDAPLVEELVSDDKLEKKTIFSTVAKIEFVRPKQQEKPVRKPADCNYHQRERVVSVNNYTRADYNCSTKKAHPSAHMNMFPKEVLMKIGLRPLNTTRPKAVNTARPNSAVVNVVRANQTLRILMEDMLPLGEEPKEGKLLVKELLKLVSLILRLCTLSRRHLQLADADGISSLPTMEIFEQLSLMGYVSTSPDFKLADESQAPHLRESYDMVRRGGTRVLVVKPHNKTPYELFRGRTPALSFKRPFGCHVTILNTLDHLGKFDGKSNDGFFVGYSLNSKAFRVYNIRTRKVEENLHVRFLEDKPIIAGNGPKWLFDIDALTKSMNYVPVVASTNSNDFVGVSKESGIDDHERPENSAQDVNTARPSINIASSTAYTDHAILKATHAGFFSDEAKVDMSNITTTYPVPSTLNIRIHKDHSLDHVIGDVKSGVQTRRTTKTTKEQGLQVTQKDDGIFFSQDKYVDEILKKFGFSIMKTASTPMETSKPLLKDAEAEDVDDSPFDLEAYTDSDYAGASLDRKSTTGGCQFLGSRLISWQCNKQTIVATSTTEAEYVAAASFHGQFWKTAIASTLNNGEMEITATIDGKVKIVTEASISRHLKLEDSDGISNFPTTKIFEQLALMGQETEVPQPSSPPHTNVADEAASTRVDVRHGGAATTVTSLDVG
ncbi:ribonuclease H-like domain-containing protein, partial [Tanacetum coccineum]